MERYILLVYYKIFLSILVITIHTVPLFNHKSQLGWFNSNGLARIAVPSFILNGYYFFDKSDNNKLIIKYSKHLVILFIIWNFIFSVFFKGAIDWCTPKELIYFYKTGFHTHWYLSGLVSDIILIILLKKMAAKNVIYILLIFLFLISGYILCKKGNILCRHIAGWGFILLGYQIKKCNLLNSVNNKLLLSYHFITTLISHIFHTCNCDNVLCSTKCRIQFTSFFDNSRGMYTNVYNPYLHQQTHKIFL